MQSTEQQRSSPAPSRSAECTASRATIATLPRRTLGLPVLLVAALLVPLSGCGVSVEQLVVQSGAALGRTYLDLLLTDLSNTLAERAEQNQTPDDDGDDDGDDGDADDGDGNGDGDGSDDVSFDDLTGDSAAGEPLYASCGGCHCADASGDCLPGASALIGVSAATLDEFLRGATAHPAKVDLTNQEIVDLQAYLASLGG